MAKSASAARRGTRGAHDIRVKRVYDPAESGDGARFLVERLWPRGIRKGALKLDGWLKEIAPSDELRRWFHHDPSRWDEFRRRYTAELSARPEGVQYLLEAARRGPITLLYAARDREHNSAVVLRDYLKRRLRTFSLTSPQRSPHRPHAGARSPQRRRCGGSTASRRSRPQPQD